MDEEAILSMPAKADVVASGPLVIRPRRRDCDTANLLFREVAMISLGFSMDKNDDRIFIRGRGNMEDDNNEE